MEQQKEYYAFISYKREDEKWAKWLQNKLEHYKFPTNLNGRTDLPKHIRPTYRDVTDSKPGVLADEIGNALHNSEWLIVICSPRSAKSTWVCKEAQTFIDLGRADHIIPFVIEGSPFSKAPTTECYPEALINLTGSKELLAANINEMGRDAAAIKVVARMFGIKFDTLWQRHEKELRKRRILGATLALLGILLAISIVIWMYIQRQETLRSNKAMLENRNRFIAEKSLALANDGQSQTAIMLLLEALDTGPYVEELNTALKNIVANCKIIKGHKSDVNSAFYNSDGSLIVTASNDSTIKIWDANTGINLRTFYGHHDKVRFATFSMNDSLVASTSNDKSIMIWNLKKENNAKVLEGHNDWVNSAIFSPDNKCLVSSSHDNSARIWSVEKGLCVDTLKGHNGSVEYAEFSPNGKYIVTASWDSTIKVWDVSSGICLHTLRGHTDGIHCAKFSPNGQYIVSSSYDKTIRVWDYLKDSCIAVLAEHTNPVTFASFSHDGKLISSVSAQSLGSEFFSKFSDENEIKVWTWPEKKCIINFKGHSDRINTVVFHPNDRQLLTASDDKSIRIRENGFVGGRVVKGIDSIKPKEITISPDGKIIALSCWDSEFVLWDTEKECILKRIKNDSCEVHSTAFSPDCKYIAVASSNGLVRVWDIALNMCIKSMKVHKGITNSVCYSPDGQYIVSTALFNNSFVVWNLNTDTRKILEGHRDYVSCATFSLRNNHIASGSNDGTIKIWNTKTYNLVETLKGHASQITALKFTPDGQYLVSASSDKSIRIWRVKTGECIRSLIGHEKKIYDIDINDNGNIIASSSRDKTVRLWDFKSGVCLRILRGHNTEVRSVCFKPQTKKLYSWSHDEKMIIWEYSNYDYLSFEELIKQLRSDLHNCKLSQEERKLYYLE